MLGRDFDAAKATAVVTATWWSGLTLYALGTDFRNTIGVLPYTLPSLGATAAGLSLGLIASGLGAWAARRITLDSLAPDEDRGFKSRLGRVPRLAQAPVRGKAIPMIESAPVRSWREWLVARSQPHAALFDAILLTLSHDMRLPATHVPGGHGGHTLLEHSLFVVERMLVHTPTWQYTGLRGRSGALLLALRDSSYVFDPTDPMIGIVALAHDLGKIECYVRDGSGKVVETRHAHDLVSGRMLGRMPEFWAIPAADRSALLGAVSYYHHPQSLPVAPDGRAADDRTIALMELLIHADTDAGRIEAGGQAIAPMVSASALQRPPAPPAAAPAGQTAAPAPVAARGAPAPSPAVATGASSPPFVSATYQDEQVWAAFVAVLQDASRVNDKNSRRNIGCKKAGLLYLREARIRELLLSQMGESSSLRLGDGRHEITVALMKVCEDRGILFNEFNGQQFSHHRAMFRVAFLDPQTKVTRATWPAAIIVRVNGVFDEISGLPDHPSDPVIERPVWSEKSAINKAKPDDDHGAAGVVPEEPIAAVPAADENAEITGFDDDEDASDAAGDEAMAAMMAPVLDEIEGRAQAREQAKHERIMESQKEGLRPSVRASVEALESINQDEMIDALMAPPKKSGKKQQGKKEVEDTSSGQPETAAAPPSMASMMASLASVQMAEQNGRIECLGEKHDARWYRLTDVIPVARKLDWEAARDAGLIQVRDIDGEVLLGLPCGAS